MANALKILVALACVVVTISGGVNIYGAWRAAQQGQAADEARRASVVCGEAHSNLATAAAAGKPDASLKPLVAAVEDCMDKGL